MLRNRGIRRVSFRMSVAALGIVAATSIGACGSSSKETSSTSSTGSQTSASAPAPAANAEAASIQYSGPESGKPTGYGIPAKKPGDYTFGYLNITSANETLNAIGKGFQAEGDALGVKTIVLDDQLKVDKQVSDFQQLLAQGVDGILVNPMDNKALTPLLQQAKAKGVPVIGMDITQGDDPLPDGYVSQIWRGRDHEAFGQAKLIAEADPKAQVGLINIAQPVPGVLYQISRVKDMWAPKFGLKVLGEQLNQTDDAAGAEQVVTPMLTKYPDMNAVIGYNDPSALGAVSAGRANGRKILAAGDNGSTDGIDGVKNGLILGTFQQDTVGQGAMALLGLYDVVTKQNLPLPPTILRESTPVTKENVNSIKSWDDQAAAIKAGAIGAGL